MAAGKQARHSANLPHGVGVIALASDNTFMHLYEDVRDLLADIDVYPVTAASHSGLDFFSSAGSRLHCVFNHRWELVDVVHADADTPEPDEVYRRVCEVMTHVELFLRDAGNTDAYRDSGYATVEDALDALPKLEALTGQPDQEESILKRALKELGASPTVADIEPVTRGIGQHNKGFLHTAWHLAGGRH